MESGQKCICNNSYKYIVLTAQCLALLPVTGVGKPLNELCFKWKSFHVFYNFFVLIMVCFLLICHIIFSADYHFDRHVLSSIVMKFNSILVLLLHLRLSLKWPKLMMHWFQIDYIMDIRYGRLTNFNLRIYVFLGFYFISTLAALIHLVLIQLHSVNYDILQLNLYSFVFNYITPNYVIAVIFLLIYFVYFSLSCFNDIFIISSSMALALRLRQIRTRLEINEKNQSKLGINWLEMRKDYNRLSHLSKEVDNGINGLILISFTYNLFTIITYLFHKLMPQNDSKPSVAFYVFFPYLCLKLLAVCFYTSWVNDEGQAPVNILNSVSSQNYNSEIGRWLVQLSFDNVALTGWKIFKITRSIYLSIISIVVTYELVIMQFYGFSGRS